MKKFLLLTTTTFLSMLSFGQADNWNSVITNGFTSPQNYNVIGFNEFKDTLYATCGRSGAGQAEMYRSGDGLTWNQVNYGTYPTVKGIASINSDTIDGGYMWMATGNLAMGTQVFRTQNGTTWIPISTPGFGNSALWSPTPHMVLYQGTTDTIPYLYAAGNSHGGPAKSMVLRTPYDNTILTNWDTIVNFNIRDTNVTQVTYFYEWNNKLYFGTNGDSLLFESTDGINFVANVGVATDFYGSDLLIACLIDFNGKLYAGTNNLIFGGQLYETPDGINWSRITSLLPNFEDSVDFELHDIDTANGYLWVTPYTDTLYSTSGMPVWRSTDASVTSFVQSNLDGFGNPLIDGANPTIYGFKGRQYFGGPNYTTGGEIWRTDLFTGIIEPSKNQCSVNIFPNPFNNNASIVLNPDCSEISKLFIYDMTGKLVRSVETSSNNIVTIERGNLMEGLYFYQLTSTKGAITSGKFIIQ